MSVGGRRQVAGQRENAPQRPVAPEFARNGGSRPASRSASTPLVATCSDGEDRPGVATRSEWRRQLALGVDRIHCALPLREKSPRQRKRPTLSGSGRGIPPSNSPLSRAARRLASILLPRGVNTLALRADRGRIHRPATL